MIEADNYLARDEKHRWKLIYEQFYPALCYFANTILKDAQKSEDVVQSVLVKLWQDKLQISEPKHLKNYLYKSVKHAAINEATTQSTRTRILDHLEQSIDPAQRMQESAHYGMVRVELLRMIQQAISKLPEKTERVFRLAYLEQKSNPEIAELLSISVNTVKVHKNNAKKALQAQLKDLYPLAVLLILRSW